MSEKKAAPKRTQGRPARTDEPERLVVRVARELKLWLAHRAIDESRDMGRIVTDALESYRKRIDRGVRP